MKKMSTKNKILITVIYIIAVLSAPLPIKVIDIFLPKVFNPAITVMYVVHGILSIAGILMIIAMWVNTMDGKKLIKNKTLIAVINIIAVLLTPLLIGAIDMFLPKAFDFAIDTMYFSYGGLSIVAILMTIWMWVNEFIEREYEKMIKQRAKEIRDPGESGK